MKNKSYFRPIMRIKRSYFWIMPIKITYLKSKSLDRKWKKPAFFIIWKYWKTVSAQLCCENSLQINNHNNFYFFKSVPVIYFLSLSIHPRSTVWGPVGHPQTGSPLYIYLRYGLLLSKIGPNWRIDRQKMSGFTNKREGVQSSTSVLITHNCKVSQPVIKKSLFGGKFAK